MKIDPDNLAALPRSHGVYIFKGDGTLPLYIGKSVDIRSRVLSHLRSRDESKMIDQARSVDYIETSGEIGALLLEARLIKQLNPLFNVRLRRMRNLCSIHLGQREGGLFPDIVSGRNVDLGQARDLYGLFSSIRATQLKLRELADQHQLCSGLIGLEKIGKRGCFGLQIKKCLGACVGLEDRKDHDHRLQSALSELKVHAWPFDGAVDLVEQNGDWVQKHRIRNWRYLGAWCSKNDQLSSYEHHDFDLDTYKILVKPIMLGTAQLEMV